MWAGAQTERAKLARSKAAAMGHRVIPVGATDLSSAKAYGSTMNKSFGGTGSGTDTADTLIADYNSYDVERDAGSRHSGIYIDGDFSASPSKGYRATVNDGDVGSSNGRGGLEMEQLKHGVVVDRTYSVRSD